jgi:hypothetical protein
VSSSISVASVLDIIAREECDEVFFTLLLVDRYILVRLVDNKV